MKRTLAGLLALAAALSLPAAARAQLTPFSIEPRIGVAAPVATTADDEQTGLAIGGDVIYRITPLVSVYGGYAWQRANAAGADSVDLSFYGWEGGIRLTFSPIGPYTPFARGGLVYKRGKAETDGGQVFTGDNATGFEVGVGTEIGIPRVPASLAPQVGFSTVQNDQWAYVQVGLHVRI